MRRFTVLALVASALLTSAAQAQDVRRAVLIGRVEPRLLERVRGQTADLPWTLERAEGTTSTFDRALAVGVARDADVVVWFDSTHGGLTVSVAEVAERRLFARRIEAPPGEALGSSATLEAAALVVRGALSDLAQGGHVGIVVPMPEPEPVEPEPEPELPPPPPPPSTRLVATIGAAIAIDGAAPRAHLGPSVRLAVDVGPVDLAIAGRTGVPEELPGEDVVAVVTRFAVSAGAAVELLEIPEWRLTLGVAAGIVAHQRSTDVRDADLEPTGPSTVGTLLVSGEARVQWMPDGGAIGMELMAGADVLAIAPRFVIEALEELRVLHSPWPVQPVVSLGLVIRAP